MGFKVGDVVQLKKEYNYTFNDIKEIGYKTRVIAITKTRVIIGYNEQYRSLYKNNVQQWNIPTYMLELMDIQKSISKKEHTRKVA